MAGLGKPTAYYFDTSMFFTKVHLLGLLILLAATALARGISFHH